MAATRIEIEHSGFGWSAEIDAHSRSVPRLLAPTLEGLLAQVLTKITEIGAVAKRGRRAEPLNENPAPRLAPPVSRRSIARLKREQRESQQETV